MKEIALEKVGRFSIGQAEDAAAATGCTVIVSPNGMPAGCDVRGGGPSSRENQLLNPLTAAQVIHAVVLSGGSSFGLGCADGVMRCLVERGIGLDVAVTKVPLAVQSDLFDLTVGDSDAYPDAAMGYRAASLALDAPNYRDGNYGAGCGASVGKIAGMETCMKTGIGSFAMEVGKLRVGAVAAVNALGDIFDPATGEMVAGVLREDKTGFRSTLSLMQQSIAAVENRFVSNTTLGVVLTNAAFDKARLCKIAGMAHDGMARTVRPVHTSADGDSIYACSVGDLSADIDLVGVLAAEAMAQAILRGVFASEGAYGLPAARDLPFLSDRARSYAAGRGEA